MEQSAVLISLLAILREANNIVTAQSPGAICVQASGVGQLETMPNTYKFWFRPAHSSDTLTIEVSEDVRTGQMTAGPVTPGGPILGVGGDLTRATVDIYAAVKAIREAGYADPIFFCGLFQAVVPHITEPWYSFTPNNCASPSSENYIFVNSITAQVRLFPSDQAYK